MNIKAPVEKDVKVEKFHRHLQNMPGTYVAQESLSYTLYRSRKVCQVLWPKHTCTRVSQLPDDSHEIHLH